MNMRVEIFTRLFALRYLGFCNVLHIWIVQTIPTNRVYHLYDIYAEHIPGITNSHFVAALILPIC